MNFESPGLQSKIKSKCMINFHELLLKKSNQSGPRWGLPTVWDSLFSLKKIFSKYFLRCLKSLPPKKIDWLKSFLKIRMFHC